MIVVSWVAKEFESWPDLFEGALAEPGLVTVSVTINVEEPLVLVMLSVR